MYIRVCGTHSLGVRTHRVQVTYIHRTTGCIQAVTHRFDDRHGAYKEKYNLGNIRQCLIQCGEHLNTGTSAL